VDPWKATNHSDITRPRMLGSEFSCSVALPIDMNDTLAPPASASATSSSGRFGARLASPIAVPRPVADMTSGAVPVFPRVATINPPTTAPTPIAAVMKPKPLEPECKPALAR
jgi:hypothetical protein